MQTNHTVTLPLKEYRELVENQILLNFLTEWAGYRKLSGEELKKMQNAMAIFMNEGHCDIGDAE